MILLFSVLMTTMMTNKDIKATHEMCPSKWFHKWHCARLDGARGFGVFGLGKGNVNEKGTVGFPCICFAYVMWSRKPVEMNM